MKRLLCLTLAALFILSPCQRARAPIPVVLGVALKCVAIGTIGATAVIIYRCSPDYYLIRVQPDGEEPHWLVSQASTATVAKNEGWTRCEGPSRDRAELDFRAWCNNQSPAFPMFPCGPLGKPLPSATWTNYAVVTLQASTDNGAHWVDLASALNEPNEPNLSFALLPATGTNGMSKADLIELAGFDSTAIQPSPSAILRFKHDVQPDGFVPPATNAGFQWREAK